MPIRMNTQLVAAALIVTTSSFGQPPSVLIEACNAMTDSDRRLVCLKAAIDANSGKLQGADTKYFALQAVEKAFTRMQSSLSVGISYNNYQTALLNLASPVAELKRVGGTELSAEGIVLLDRALDTYSDAAKLWQTSITFYARRDNELSYFRGLPLGLTSMEWLVSKYQLAIINVDLLGFHRGVHVDSTRARLWAIASERSTKGLKMLKGNDLVEPRIEDKQSRTIVHDGITWSRPINADLTSSFTSHSKGVAFEVPNDTPVQAAAAGVVVLAGNKLTGYANLIIIKHDDRYLTAYYQNSRLLVVEGDAVAQGQIIATSGERFAFEVRLRGLAVDPSAYLPPR